MSPESPAPKLFLLGQQLRHLTDVRDPKERRFYVCGGKEERESAGRFRGEQPKEDPWKPRGRDQIVLDAAGATPWQRVGLVCSAGLGKTTNMKWLAAQFAGRGTRQVPLLLRLDDREDMSILLEERRRGGDADALVNRLVQLVLDANERTPNDRARYLAAIRRLQAAGRITLLIDGLDHAMSTPKIGKMLKEMIDSKQWRHCPVWISGRPEAFESCWDQLFGEPHWEFLQVQPLAEPEIRFYLDQKTGGDWYDVFPDNSRWLLGIPRLLGLIGDILVKEIHRAASEGIATAEAVRRLDLKTATDVYYRAYFEKGQYADRDSQGLLAQGLRGESDWIGLPRLPETHDDYVEPSKANYDDRLERVGVLLGAIAFEMFALNSAANPPTPNLSGVEMSLLRKKVAPALVAAGQGTAAQFDRDLLLLEHMNNNTLKFMLFREASGKQYLWDNRDVLAFFAAHWAMNHATTVDLKRWVQDAKGERLPGFDEFWHFAAEMPDAALKPKGVLDTLRWLDIFKPCYATPEQLESKKDGEVQWCREMIYHSYPRMEKRSLQTVEIWRALWLKLESGEGTPKQKRIYQAIAGRFRRCPKDPMLDYEPFWMGSPQDEEGRDNDEIRRLVKVAPFALHEFPVTNEQYELFDLTHKTQRDEDSKGDGRPVIHVTFWDAACFALWTGNRLPTEQEWEYACRAGTTTRYWWGDAIDSSRCNYSQSNIGRTSAKDEFPYKANPWLLFDMHGNVHEWCDSLYESGGSARVFRGGSWYISAWSCRSAYRYRRDPSYRLLSLGFRLAVPSPVTK